MKWFTKLTNSINTPSMLKRRRTRQRAATNARPFELAAAHVRLMMTMAAADGFVEQSELDEVERVINRLPLAPGDATRLHELAASLDRSQLALEQLEPLLAHFTASPRFATGLVIDLSRVATVGGEEHARQVLLMEEVCETLGFSNPLAQPAFTLDDEPAPTISRGHLDYARELRMRESVFQALERSYAS